VLSLEFLVEYGMSWWSEPMSFVLVLAALGERTKFSVLAEYVAAFTVHWVGW